MMKSFRIPGFELYFPLSDYTKEELVQKIKATDRILCPIYHSPLSNSQLRIIKSLDTQLRNELATRNTETPMKKITIKPQVTEIELKDVDLNNDYKVVAYRCKTNSPKKHSVAILRSIVDGAGFLRLDHIQHQKHVYTYLGDCKMDAIEKATRGGRDVYYFSSFDQLIEAIQQGTI